jgi:hypothetical protein
MNTVDTDARDVMGARARRVTWDTACTIVVHARRCPACGRWNERRV